MAPSRIVFHWRLWARSLCSRVAVLGTLVIGVYPRLLFEVAELSAKTLGAAAVAAALR